VLRYRRLAVLAFCAATVTVVAAGLPAAAQAAGGTVTIVSAGSPPGNPSLLEITATATTDITTISAELTPVGGGTAYAVPALTLTSGIATDGTWSVSIPSGAIAAGNYTIGVNAEDSEGDSVADTDAGTLAYLYQPTLTANDDVATIDYGEQTVTFSGQLTAVPPGGGTGVEESGVPVYYEPAGGTTPEQIAITQSDGTYSATVTVTGNEWYIGTDATSTVAAAQSSELSYGPVQTQLNNATITPSTLSYGETATLTGTINFGYGTGAVANAPVEIMDGSVQLPTVTTNASGVFTTTFPTADGENLQITSGEDNALLTPSSAGLSFTVPWPLRSKLFKAKLDGAGYVVSGICLQTNPPNFDPFDPNSVELQYAPSSHGPWQALGTLPGVASYENPRGCDASDGWSYYSDSVTPIPGRLINAYYRVVVPGNGSIEPFTGPVVHSSLNRSRIVSFRVSPKRVSQGDRTTISGVLEKHGRSWSGYSGQRVYIVVWPRGHRDEAGALFVLHTGHNGRFSRTFTAGSAKGRIVFAAVFDGNSSYLWSASGDVTVAFNSRAAGRVDAGTARIGSYLEGQERLQALPRAVAAELLVHAS
jgi:hypothetical protein